MWKSVLCDCGLKYRSLYNTRHTFASIMLSRGEDIAWISRIMLGHKNISITYDSYVGYIPTKEKHAKFLESFMSDSIESNTDEAFLEFGKKIFAIALQLKEINDEKRRKNETLPIKL